MSYAIRYDIGDFERSLGELIKKLENRAPLMREVAAAMGDAVEENFAQQGRPAWMGWSPAYARQRRGGKILQKSGRLAASITQYSTNDEATVGTNVKYARIHQEGGEISIPARSQKAYYRQNKDGSLKNPAPTLSTGTLSGRIKLRCPRVLSCISPKMTWRRWRIRLSSI